MISINGKKFSGNSISINNNKIIIDGNIVDDGDSSVYNISIDGNLDSLSIECGNVSVSGNVNKIDTVSGDVNCKDVFGNIKTVSGDVDCHNISGGVKTVSGDISN